jgi:hypothetical protein
MCTSIVLTVSLWTGVEIAVPISFCHSAKDDEESVLCGVVGLEPYRVGIQLRELETGGETGDGAARPRLLLSRSTAPASAEDSKSLFCAEMGFEG